MGIGEKRRRCLVIIISLSPKKKKKEKRGRTKWMAKSTRRIHPLPYMRHYYLPPTHHLVVHTNRKMLIMYLVYIAAPVVCFTCSAAPHRITRLFFRLPISCCVLLLLLLLADEQKIKFFFKKRKWQ